MASKGRRFHQAALERATTFAARMKNQSLNIDHKLSSKRSKHIAKNVWKLQSIVETVIFCRRQGIAFRSHHDDRTAVEEDTITNHDNFLALLHFRILAGD